MSLAKKKKSTKYSKNNDHKLLFQDFISFIFSSFAYL